MGWAGLNTSVAEPAFNMQEELIDIDRFLKEEVDDARVEQAEQERQVEEAKDDAWRKKRSIHGG